ncbi:MAG: helix-turn-helix transcriptional regulator [Sphingomonadaceae bacterium]|nr:helix-turn-helix transcriptional regulator [Sphingomonadaceae bacterium]
MQLTSTDETDLLIPLYAGVHDQAQWVTFLSRIQRRTGADYAALIFAQGDMPIHQSKEVFAGHDLRAEARQLGMDSLYAEDRAHYDRLRPGRVYHMAEFAAGDQRFRETQDISNQRLGLSDTRIVRIKEQEGTSAWLTLVSKSHLFAAVDGALLTAVAPHVAIALQSFVLTERQRIRAAASCDGLSRAGVGWIVLGRDARIIDIDPNLAPLLQAVGGAEHLLGERLPSDTPQVRQDIQRAASDFANNVDAMPRAITLMQEPRLDALLVPMRDRPEAALAMPVMLAICRMPRDSNADRLPMLTALFGLSRRESELAFALSDGRTISEAANLMGLTEETARNYTKRIYAKMGVRGQAELVRQIFLSSASLA